MKFPLMTYKGQYLICFTVNLKASVWSEICDFHVRQGKINKLKLKRLPAWILARISFLKTEQIQFDLLQFILIGISLGEYTCPKELTKFNIDVEKVIENLLMGRIQSRKDCI